MCQSVSDFVFVYLYVNVLLTRLTVWLEMYQMKIFIEMEQLLLSMLLLLSSWFEKTCIYSVSYMPDKYFIYYFCSTIKDLSISFSRVMIIQDFKTTI